MRKRTKKEGFTLIELLVTIVILGISVVLIGGIVLKINDLSNNKKNNIMLSSIKTSALDYTNEFKLEDKYWFVDSSSTDIEYACTTVGMLINKGFLNDNVIGLKIDNDKIISSDTSIRIDRNRNTKVYNDFVLFNESLCDEVADIEVAFTVNGTSNDGYSNWYNDDVTIGIIVNNLYFVQDYEYLYNDIKKSYHEENPLSENWNIKVDEQGKNIDICLNFIDIKDNKKKVCLSDNNQVYNMDKEKPNVPLLSLDKNSNYELVSKNASDNITARNDLVYYLSEYVNGSKGNAKWSISSDIRTSNELVSSYVVDEAGNKSDVVTGRLNISDSVNVTSVTKYYCEENEIYYDKESTASNNCYGYYDGTVIEKNIYYCDDGRGGEYFTESDAIEYCSYSEHIETDWLCLSGECYTEGIYECYEKSKGEYGWAYIRDGYGTDHTCAGAGYPGLTKIYTCTSFPSCNTPGELVNIYRECDYYCVGDYTYDNYSSYSVYECDLDGSTYDNYYTAVSWCYESYSGNVVNKYYCSVTNKYYNSLSAANNACLNQCSKGTYYNGGCYSFEK